MYEYCDNCALALGNNFKPVRPYGDINSKLFIISNSPTYKDAKENKVFSGKAGLLFKDLLAAESLLDYVYITNSVKCRTPMGRTPYLEEIVSCKPHLIEELRVGKPKIIVLLGNTAINSFFNKDINMVGKLHNKGLQLNKTIILFGYHPSVLLVNPDKMDSYKRFIHKIRLIYNLKVNRYV